MYSKCDFAVWDLDTAGDVNKSRFRLIHFLQTGGRLSSKTNEVRVTWCNDNCTSVRTLKPYHCRNTHRMGEKGRLTLTTSIVCIMPYVFIFTGVLITLYVWNVILLSTLKLLLGVFAVIFIIGPLVYKSSYRIQRSTIFLNYVTVPLQPNVSNPSKCGIKGVLNFYLTTNDDVKLGVWHIVPEDLIEESTNQDESYYKSLLSNGRDIIIYNHGNAGNRSAPHRLELYEVLRRHFHVITFDYRSYGDSSNIPPCEMGAVRDSMYVYKWVRELTESNIYIWGHSLGTAISTHMLSLLTTAPNGLILESPFNNMRDEIGKHPIAFLFRSLPWFTYTVLNPVYDNNLRFKTDEHINNVHCPIMILHAKDDCIVPYNLGLKLYQDAQVNRRENQGKLYFRSFEATHKYGHKYICRAPELSTIIQQFVSECNVEKMRTSAL
ncbi:hypothetical protein RN001_014863 [Aquatica leii]|uniref:AB hydrolase-1 domain-containing protein n=1 Tax=Aquatica leii TaxID=1421715 RepID=A0AAN7SBX5_9COLE|nr:hypothetical protein RN001_014863 [Aquatica leii]